jgi:hypothetical protein
MLEKSKISVQFRLAVKRNGNLPVNVFGVLNAETLRVVE